MDYATRLLVGLLAATMFIAGCPDNNSDPVEKDPIYIHGIFDQTGPTGGVGISYAAAILDYIAETNETGGIEGHQIVMEGKMTWNEDTEQWEGEGDWVDYQYSADRAIAVYDHWKSEADWGNIATIFGWGTGDSIALSETVAQDKMVYLSASYAGALAAPVAINKTIDLGDEVSFDIDNPGHPYNFFTGLDYSTAIRAGLEFAKQDGASRVAFVGCTAGYCTEPIVAGRQYAKSIGLVVEDNPNPGNPDCVVELSDKDEAVVETKVKDFLDAENAAGRLPDFIWVANTTTTAALIVKTAATHYPDIKFILNVWGFDENLPGLCGDACRNRTYGIVNVRAYGDMQAAGMANVVRIHDKYRQKASEDSGLYADVRYIQGVVSFITWKEAVRRLAVEGSEITSVAIKDSLETLDSFQTGGLLAGPITFNGSDHRSTNQANIYSINNDDGLTFEKAVNVELEADWLGW
jgi:branched-chain amino acid transport system substrate-binding protein